MHNRALHDTLAAFVEEAARQLAEELSGGAEVPFELVEEGSPPTPLYCYRPQPGRFIADRAGMLGRLGSYPAAVQGLAALPRLADYLRAHTLPAAGDARARADAALQAFLTDVWADATEFASAPERFAAAYAELERLGYAGLALARVLAPVEGLVLESDHVALGEGLSLLRADALEDAPPELQADPWATVAALRSETPQEEGASLEAAGRRLRQLQTALRLWDDSQPSLGPFAWAQTGEGPWAPVPLATGLRRPSQDCLLGAEEEDPLRAFCSLVARRTPRSGELAWALRRFELGAERASLLEALSDWLLAVRALLGDAEAPEQALVRLTALCAAPEERAGLGRRLGEAAALERAVVSGLVHPVPPVEALVAELGGQLRAVLRDVLCGHLDPDLRGLADELLAEAAAPA